MSEMTDKCAHPSCHCPARMDTEYCSESCELAKDEDEQNLHKKASAEWKSILRAERKSLCLLAAMKVCYGKLHVGCEQFPSLRFGFWVLGIRLSSSKFAAPPPDVREVCDLPADLRSLLFGATPLPAGA